MIQMTELRIPSADGVHRLYCRVYTPDTEVKGLLHVVHGMTEHIVRYESFMREMAENGYLCYGFDNLGHGHTVNDPSELGDFGVWQHLVSDVQQVSRQMKAAYGKGLPCFLMGHSLGSFIARCAASPHIWDKAVFMGTAGPHPATKPGLELLRLKIKKNGERGYSPAIEKLIFSTFNKRFRAENDPRSWLGTQPEARNTHRDDPLRCFHFKLNGLYVLVKLHALCNSKLWFRSVSADLPMLLLSGSDDPVGYFGKGVTTVYEHLIRNGKQAEIKLYPGFRHELLFDSCRGEVVQDILRFLQK